MEKDGLPSYSSIDEYAFAGRPHRRHRRRSRLTRLVFQALFIGALYAFYSQWLAAKPTENVLRSGATILSTARLHADYATCGKLRANLTFPSGPRERSARYINGHKPVLIRNATVWTGEPVPGTSAEDAHYGKGYSWINADVYMEYGLIKRVEAGVSSEDIAKDAIIYEAHGRQLTTGIIDMHSHSGVGSLPGLKGNEDSNELSSNLNSFVRSIDGYSPLDKQIQVIKSGGVTTSLVLPGSGSNFGGEAFVFKHAVGKPDGRAEISPADMLADRESNLRWMKMACGENAKRVFGKLGTEFGPTSRLGEAWWFRHSFEQAAALVKAQDDWCSSADYVGFQNMQSYLPQELKWESLAALLRGQILLNTHCYTVQDLSSFVSHTNEFGFAVRAFHHAHSTYLVPEILKRVWGGRPPASALFADNMYYKAESYVASEQAGKILWENGLTPLFVSDNPVLNAEHVLFEAARAFKNGLPYHVALAGVTSASAETLGLGERIGKVKPGFDADIVVWDSDPLSVGAAPVQIWIDGTAQFENPVELKKPAKGPIVPNQDLQEIKTDMSSSSDVVFKGISKVMLPGQEEFVDSTGASTMIVRDGQIICLGTCNNEVLNAQKEGIKSIHLKNGYVAPPAIAFGTPLGLVEIGGEAATQDGENKDETFSRAVDGLALDGKQLAAVLSKGVAGAVSAPAYRGGNKGVSVGFRTGALNAMEKGAIWKDEVALHYTIVKSDQHPAISNAIGALRGKLLKAVSANHSSLELFSEGKYLHQVVRGELPLVLNTDSADQMASLLTVKSEVESAIKDSANAGAAPMSWIFQGGAESWIVADALAKADVAVVLSPLLAYAVDWQSRRTLFGAPYDNGTAIDVLHAAGVKVIISALEESSARNLYLDAGIAYANGNGKISEREALSFVSSNVYDILGIKKSKLVSSDEFVLFEGSPLEIDGRVRAVADGSGKVTIWS